VLLLQSLGGDDEAPRELREAATKVAAVLKKKTVR
jgi:hypothetical protein